MNNREIKFRAWDGDRMHTISGQGLHLVLWNDPTRIAWGVYDASEARVADSQYGGVLMQYTGLKDKDGRGIYEGDVIESMDSAGNPIRHVVEFDESEGRFAACYLYGGRKDYPGSMRQAWLNEYDKVVIGNIYETPELLYP